MTTDGTSDITQDYKYSDKRFTCLLNEGTVTVSTAYDLNGKSQTVCSYASELHEGDWVAISNDTGNTYAATGGMLLVEKPVSEESLIIGRIVGLPGRGKVPSNTEAANTLAERLSGGYCRNAIVEVLAFNAIVEGTFMCNGTNAQVPGVATTSAFNLASGYTNHGLWFDSSSQNGVNAVPLHYVAAGTDGDTYTSLYGITGMLFAITGA